MHEKFFIKEYGCTPPFFENKENICTNETISIQVFKSWKSTYAYVTNCSDPCKVISLRSMKFKITKGKNKTESKVKFYFQKRVKVVKSYYTQGGR